MGVTLTPNLIPNVGLFLPLGWVVFTLFGVTLTLKVEQENFRYGITPFLGLFFLSISGVIFHPEKEFFKLRFWS